MTGSATGIGQGIAHRFAQEGAAVVIDYVGPASSAQATVQAVQSAGGRAISVEADITDEQQVQNLFGKTLAAFGAVDIVVNNAGVEKKFAFVDYPIAEARKILDVNLLGPFVVSQSAARQMIKQGNGGRIINISSVHEDLAMPTNAAYCASKGGVRMLMRTIAVELAPHKITVNNIGPGAIYTPIDAEIEANPALEKTLLAEIPLHRWGRPEEVAGLAVYLASDEAGYVTGASYFIDGGMMRQSGSF